MSSNKKGKTGKTGSKVDPKHLSNRPVKLQVIKDGRDLNKYVGGKINDKINEGGRKVDKAVSGAIHAGASKLIERGADKNIVNYGSKVIRQGTGQMIRQGVGAAKNFIHTEGRNLGRKIKEGAQNLGKRTRDWFENVGRKFKRQK